ncbi:MAG: hypothetical protein HUJ96_06560 [Marinilabiliaceae bacterium]|nr:hypothetical protein [Marinilabiliaceae bacterium]
MKRFTLLLFLAIISNILLCQNKSKISLDSLAIDTLNFESMYVVGKWHEHNKRHSIALPFFERANRLTPSDSVKYAIAYNLFQSGYYRRSAILSKEITERDSFSIEKLTLLATNYEKLLDKDSAVVVQMRICTLEPDNSWCLINMCKNMIALDEISPSGERLDTALYFLNRYREIDTLNLFINELYGRELYFKRNFEESLSIYKKLKMAGDERSLVNYYLAQNYSYLDSIPQAFSAYEYLLEQIKWDSPSIIYKYGLLCANNDSTEKAIELLNMALEKMEIPPTTKYIIHKNLGRCYYLHGQCELAEKSLKEAHKNKEKDSDVIKMLINIYFKEGNINQEKIWIEKLVKVTNETTTSNQDEGKISWYEDRLKEINELIFMKGDLKK